jgi:hypothetical protein
MGIVEGFGRGFFFKRLCPTKQTEKLFSKNEFDSFFWQEKVKQKVLCSIEVATH